MGSQETRASRRAPHGGCSLRRRGGRKFSNSARIGCIDQFSAYLVTAVWRRVIVSALKQFHSCGNRQPTGFAAGWQTAGSHDGGKSRQPARPWHRRSQRIRRLPIGRPFDERSRDSRRSSSDSRAVVTGSRRATGRPRSTIKTGFLNAANKGTLVRPSAFAVLRLHEFSSAARRGCHPASHREEF